MPEITLEARDERAITIPVPSTQEQLNALAVWAQAAANDGFALKYAAALEGGHQRDPYTVGLRLTVERRPS